jgi:hypothetical protein
MAVLSESFFDNSKKTPRALEGISWALLFPQKLANFEEKQQNH